MKHSRRDFLKTSAALSSFVFLPSSVIGREFGLSPNEKLNIAAIGAGGMGMGSLPHLETENIVALCDVDWERAKEPFEKYPNANKYKDYREMLDKEKSIDAVLIATPDHVHAPATMAAIERGLHVYCEKPLTHTVHEARMVTKVAKEAGVATQMGNQGHAKDSFRLLKEWILDGAIGDVYEVHAWTPHPVWPQGMIRRPTDTPPVPETLAWNLWLGPAKYRPYHPVYLPQLWRGWLDFGTGGLGDMGCHILDHVVWALELGPPNSIEGSHSHFVEEVTWDIPPNNECFPRASMVTYRFPKREGLPPVKVVWYDGGLKPERPEELEDGREMGDGLGGAIYVGTKGKIMSGSHGANGARIIPEKAMQEYTQPPKSIERSPGHHKEWIDACKGGKPALSNFDYAGPLTETVLLGNIALKTGKKLYWDSTEFKFANDDEANSFLTKEYRDGWKI